MKTKHFLFLSSLCSNTHTHTHTHTLLLGSGSPRLFWLFVSPERLHSAPCLYPQSPSLNPCGTPSVDHTHTRRHVHTHTHTITINNTYQPSGLSQISCIFSVCVCVCVCVCVSAVFHLVQYLIGFSDPQQLRCFLQPNAG